MKLYTIIAIIIFACSSLIVSANMYSSDDYASNFYYQGSPIMGICSSSIPAFGNQEYHVNAIENPLYNPVLADFDGDYSVEAAIVVDTRTIHVYDHLGNIKYIINVSYPIMSRPALTNPDYYDHTGNLYKYDLAVLTNKTLDIYNMSALKYTLDYYSIDGNLNMSDLACTDHHCFSLSRSNNIVATFTNILGITLTSNKSMTGAKGTTYSATNSPTAQTYGGADFYSFCAANSSSGSQVYCQIYNSSSDRVNTFTVTGQYFNQLNALLDYTAAYVKMGVLYYYVLSVHTNQQTGNQGSQMVVYNPSSFSTVKDFCDSTFYCTGNTIQSSPSVGDYDKDGQSEFCYFLLNGSATIANFTCYSNSFSSPKHNIQVNLTELSMSYIPMTFYMADFNSSSATLEIATREGIYHISSDTNYKIASSGITATQYSDKPIVGSEDNTGFDVVNIKWNGNPMFYSTSTINSFVMSSFSLANFCGDGVCSGSENVFTCPQDCVINNVSNFQCNNDAQCFQTTPAYPKCLNHTCVNGYSGIVCLDSSVCPINASVCYSGYCINGVFGGTVGTNGTNVNLPFGVQIDNMFRQLFGGSSILRFIVGLCLLLYLTFEINRKYNPDGKQQAVLYITFSVLLVMFTFLNLITKWVVYTIIIVTLTMLVIGAILKFKPSEG